MPDFFCAVNPFEMEKSKLGLMDEMHIKCPHCGNEMEVSLQGKKSSMVVCVCGRCKSPLVTLDGDVFELDREEFHALRKKLARVVDALRECAETGRVVPPVLEKRESVRRDAEKADKISQEDVDNLKIDLETCKDVSEFIDRL